MKSDKQTRKAVIRRPSRSSDDINTYDFTDKPDCADDIVVLSTIGHGLSHEHDVIAAMPRDFESVQDVIDWCGAMACESPVVSNLWAELVRDGWALGLGDLKNSGFFYDMERKIAVLDHFSLTPVALGGSPYFRNALLANLVRVLRDIWHERSCRGQETILRPEDFLMQERIRAADCETVALLAAWEWRGAGYADVWRHMIGAEEGDMALTFTRHLERDPAAVFDGSALSYAFRQWFANETRVDTVDHQTLEMLDTAVAAGLTDFGQERLSAEAIDRMSALPDGILYLKGIGAVVRDDPFFAGLHDPINQTHLFHLIYDAEVVMVNNVPFRDRSLARLIFPEEPGRR